MDDAVRRGLVSRGSGSGSGLGNTTFPPHFVIQDADGREIDEMGELEDEDEVAVASTTATLNPKP